MTIADIKDPPKYHWYCERCATPFSTWSHANYHRLHGHSVVDFEWPPKEKRHINRRVPFQRSLMVIPTQTLAVVS